MTLVTIITPSFNQAAFLERTIRSVLEQDYLEVEYLIVDGGSTDGSLDIIRKYAPRLAWWASQPDRGQADAINTGLARARGEVVAWLNSDDYYLPGAVADAVQTLEQNPRAGMVYGDMLAVDAEGATLNRLRYRQLTLRDLLCFEIIGQPAVFLRRAALERAGPLDVAYHLLLDHQLWIRVAATGNMLHVPRTWAAARFHAAAKNRARARDFGREAFMILEWAAATPELTPTLAGVSRRARASAHRVEARYLLDAGTPGLALVAWSRALVLCAPVALARLNIPGSAVLELLGLGALRRAWLQRRQIAATRPREAP